LNLIQLLTCSTKLMLQLSNRARAASRYRPMSELGHKRTLRHVRLMSAIPPKADINPVFCDVRFVPKADISSVWNLRTQGRGTSSWGGECLSAQTRRQARPCKQNAGTNEYLTGLRLIAVFATYASPTIATSFGRHRKLVRLGSVATMACQTARSTANRPVQLSHRSLWQPARSKRASQTEQPQR